MPTVAVIVDTIGLVASPYIPVGPLTVVVDHGGQFTVELHGGQLAVELEDTGQRSAEIS